MEAKTWNLNGNDDTDIQTKFLELVYFLKIEYAMQEKYASWTNIQDPSCSSSSLQIAGQVRQIFKVETNIASHVFVLSLQVVDIQGQRMEYTDLRVCTHTDHNIASHCLF